MRLHEARRAGDDHSADRVGAHDVRVVVDLDPTRRPVEPEGLAQGHQQLALGGRIGEAPGQRLLGVALRVIDEVLPLAAARPVDLDAVSTRLDSAAATSSASSIPWLVRTVRGAGLSS